MRSTEGERGTTLGRAVFGGILGHGWCWCLGGVLVMCSAIGVARETMQWEALGVINGQVSATRSTQVDMTVFLSGQALFSATDLTASSLVIERATVVSQDGATVRIQQSVPLAHGETGQLQVPLQVRLDDKVVSVAVSETSQGVQLTLPARDVKTVAVYPAGAVQLTVPARYRGDIEAQVRITTGDQEPEMPSP